jgi:cytochrome oxidase Cu insertion factor (SCO1/SenC/PrrC family)
MSSKAGSKQRNDERLFFYAATIMSLLFGAGFFWLLFALNSRDQTHSLPAAANPNAAAIAPDHPRQLVNFSLTDRTGRTLTQSELAGKFLVVDFLLTRCSLTCPVVNQHMAQIQQLTTNQPDVRLVSLTVDPRDDTADVLAQYAARFGADTNRWLFLTGDKTELYGLIATSFLAQDADNQFGYMPGNFSHTERIAVVDSRGRVQAYFDGLNDDVHSAVVAEINRLRKSISPSQ